MRRVTTYTYKYTQDNDTHKSLTCNYSTYLYRVCIVVDPTELVLVGNCVQASQGVMTRFDTN